MATKHIDLLGDHAWIIALVKTRGKQPVPEERHLFFQRALGGDHAIHPANLCPIELKRLLGIDVVALQEIFLNCRSGLGMEQSLDCGLIALCDGCLQFVAWSAKACPTE